VIEYVVGALAVFAWLVTLFVAYSAGWAKAFWWAFNHPAEMEQAIRKHQERKLRRESE
jgi:hypothetical protein